MLRRTGHPQPSCRPFRPGSTAFAQAARARRPTSPIPRERSKARSRVSRPAVELLVLLVRSRPASAACARGGSGSFANRRSTSASPTRQQLRVGDGPRPAKGVASESRKLVRSFVASARWSSTSARSRWRAAVRACQTATPAPVARPTHDGRRRAEGEPVTGHELPRAIAERIRSGAHGKAAEMAPQVVRHRFGRRVALGGRFLSALATMLSRSPCSAPRSLLGVRGAAGRDSAGAPLVMAIDGHRAGDTYRFGVDDRAHQLRGRARLASRRMPARDIRYSSTPSAYTSVAAVTSPPVTCSGAAYSGVSIDAPSRVSAVTSPAGFTFQQLGDAEIEQLDLAVRAHQHVGRLDVAVHDQIRVRVGDGGQHVQEQRGCAPRRPGSGRRNRRRCARPRPVPGRGKAGRAATRRRRSGARCGDAGGEPGCWLPAGTAPRRRGPRGWRSGA